MIAQSILGIFVLIGLAWVMSENRRKVSWKGSLGILIGGMGSMVPERRGEIVSLGMRSIISGTLATCMAGAIVGIIT